MLLNHNRFFLPKLVASSLRAAGVLGILIAGVFGSAAFGQTRIGFNHRARDPSRPLEQRAAQCTLVDVEFDVGEDHDAADIKHVYAKLAEDCRVKLGSGEEVTFESDSDPKLEVPGETTTPARVPWLFPSGCAVFVHVYMSNYTDYKDTTIPASIVHDDHVKMLIRLTGGVKYK